jgi:hypothetical protein
MGWNWQMYETQWKRKRKNSDNKRMFRDCDLVKQDDGSFNIYWAHNVWAVDPVTKKYKPKRADRQLLGSITPDNVLTVQYDKPVCLTSMKRLTYMIGMEVFSDTSRNKTKKHKVRVAGCTWSSKDKVMPWCPSGKNPRDGCNIPYSAGMQFRMDNGGHPIELVKVEEDIKMLVKNEAIQQAKADTKVIRVLIRGMVRLGVFDQQIQDKLDRVWHHSARRVIKVEEVNYKTPLGSDAESVFLLGLEKSSPPDRSTYVNNQWVQRNPEEIRALLVDNAIENGMKALRRHIYETTGGLERIAV